MLPAHGRKQREMTPRCQLGQTQTPLTACLLTVQQGGFCRPEFTVPQPTETQVCRGDRPVPLGLKKGRKAEGRLVEGHITTGWKAALGGLAIAYRTASNSKIN